MLRVIVSTDGGMVLRCPHCDAEDSLEYHERCTTTRDLDSVDVGTRTVWLDASFEWGDGDDDPGIVCGWCCRPVALPEGWCHEFG